MKQLTALFLCLFITVSLVACVSPNSSSSLPEEEPPTEEPVSPPEKAPTPKPKSSSTAERSKPAPPQEESEESSAPSSQKEKPSSSTPQSSEQAAETLQNSQPVYQWRAYDLMGMTHQETITDPDLYARIAKSLKEMTVCNDICMPPTGAGSSLVVEQDGQTTEYVFGEDTERHTVIRQFDNAKAPWYFVEDGLENALREKYFDEESLVEHPKAQKMWVVKNYTEVHDGTSIVGEHARVEVTEDWEVDEILSVFVSETLSPVAVDDPEQTASEYLTIEIFDETTRGFTHYLVKNNTDGKAVFRESTAVGQWYLAKEGLYESLTNYYFK